MVKIRLARTGKKGQPSYRVVVAEITAKRDGRIVENIGHYNPLPNPAEVVIKEDRALYWLGVGAQPTDSVQQIFKKHGLLERFASLKTAVPQETPVEVAPENQVEAESVAA